MCDEDNFFSQATHTNRIVIQYFLTDRSWRYHLSIMTYESIIASVICQRHGDHKTRVLFARREWRIIREYPHFHSLRNPFVAVAASLCISDAGAGCSATITPLITTRN